MVGPCPARPTLGYTNGICGAKIPLRAGLIRAAKMHEYLISLHSVYEPAINRSSLLQRFERSNAVKICNRIMFNFYLGLAHMCI